MPAGLLCWQVEHFFAPEAALEEEERLRKEREERQAAEAAAADPPAEVRCSQDWFQVLLLLLLLLLWQRTPMLPFPCPCALCSRSRLRWTRPSSASWRRCSTAPKCTHSSSLSR